MTITVEPAPAEERFTSLPLRAEQEPDGKRPITLRLSASDLLYRSTARTGGMIVLALMAMVGIFLGYRGVQALRVAGFSFLTTSAWEPDSGKFGIAAVMTGTLLIGLVAITVAVPLSVGTALYISEYAPRQLKRTLVGMVDLMAAVPSVVYGLWGAYLFQDQAVYLARFLAAHLGWIPLFAVKGNDPTDPLSPLAIFTSSTFIAGTVVGMMITPVACSVMREVFTQAPAGEREGAFALGATRWGMIRSVVLPFGKGGIIGGSMLGLGRALGETIAVAMIISPVFAIQPHILQNGANSVSALIALRNGDASTMGISALMAAGLALFLMTLVVNFIASSIIARSRSGASSDA